MRKLALVTALGLAALAANPGLAATAQDTFTVAITLQPVCTIAFTDDALALAYTAGGSAVTNSGAFGAVCTNNVAYSLSMTGVGTEGGTAGSRTGIYAGTDTAGTSSGTDLPYTLRITDDGNTNAVVTSESVLVGTGSNKTYTVTASIIAGQAGRCTTTAETAVADGTCASSTLNGTVTLTY